MTKIKKINTTHSASNADDHIEVILFCPDLIQKRKKAEELVDLFDEINVEGIAAQSVLFLKLESALQYSRFMQNSHGLLRAFIPHHAIEGHTHGLAIKRGTLAKTHIHGVYPGDKKGSIYIENPHFAVQLDSEK